MIPGISTLVSAHENVLLARSSEDEQKISIFKMDSAMAVPLYKFAACHAHIKNGVVHAVEAVDGEPALVTYSVALEDDNASVFRQAPRRLEGLPDSGAVNFELSHAGERALILSRVSQQLWVM